MNNNRHCYPDTDSTEWFTVEEIDSETYAISEYKHWEETHSYLLVGSEEALLIDTGMGIGDISSVVATLTDKPVTVIATHVHYDHVGGHKHYANNFYVHGEELEWITGNFALSDEQIRGFVTELPCEFPDDFDLEQYCMFKGTPRKIVVDNEMIGPADRRVLALHTPGHSPGHLCFYDPERQYLFTGDLIYIGELFLFFPSTDPVAYRNSVKRLLEFPVTRLLPAHHDLDIQPGIIGEIAGAFDELAERGQLRHGSGVFDHGKFQLKL